MRHSRSAAMSFKHRRRLVPVSRCRACAAAAPIVAATTEDRFEYEQDGGPKLAQFANDERNKWNQFPWQ
jgi:hypothetical protein